MTFRDDLTALINVNSLENGSNTPDHVLADYLNGCLIVFDKAVRMRDSWYGVDLKPGAATSTQRPNETPK